MKTAEEWLKQAGETFPAQIADTDCDRDEACICERCKKGREIFLLAKDIELIQQDAFAAGQTKGQEDGMREAAKLIEKSGVECLTYNEDCLVDTIKQNILSAIERKQP